MDARNKTVPPGEPRALQAQLEAATALAGKQYAEIERLRMQLEGERAGRQLHDSLLLVASAGTMARSVRHAQLLEMIVTVAARVIRAQAASLFLVDAAAGELVFEVALGNKAVEVKKFRVPLGRGVAGLVAASGQPIAISNAQQDPRHASEIGQAVGYLPQSIVCVPLFYNEEVIGVLELLDKIGAPSFSPTDMEVLELFAEQAAITIEQSRIQSDLSTLLLETLRQAEGGTDPLQQQDLSRKAAAYLPTLAAEPVYREAIEVARLVQTIAARGESELEACKAVLQVFAGYLAARESRESLSNDFGMLGAM